MSSDVKAILSLEVPLIVLLGERKMRLREVKSLIPGAIIEIPKHADEELEVLVNNKRIGTGLPVKVGENFGVRISYIGDLRQRIRALGAGEPAAAAEDAGDTGEGQHDAAEAALAERP